jgi:hypothetical protein
VTDTIIYPIHLKIIIIKVMHPQVGRLAAFEFIK